MTPINNNQISQPSGFLRLYCNHIFQDVKKDSLVKLINEVGIQKLLYENQGLNNLNWTEKHHYYHLNKEFYALNLLFMSIYNSNTNIFITEDVYLIALSVLIKQEKTQQNNESNNNSGI
jgi:hypothetical protein